MLVRYPPERLRRDSDQPTAITNVMVATSPSTHRAIDLPLGLPTSSSRTRRGLWALYPDRAEVVVVHPGGAIAGSPVEVARELHRLGERCRDEPDRAAARALLPFLTTPDPTGGVWWPAATTWSRPAKGYWLSGPGNHAGQHDPAPLWPGVGMPARLPDPPVGLPSATPDRRRRGEPHRDPEAAPPRAA